MTYSFISYRAFGDLVIAVTSIERIILEQRQNIQIVFGSHLLDLVAAVAPDVATEVISFGETHLPSLFDIRKSGISKAVYSAFMMQRSFQNRSKNTHDIVVFDKCGIRENIISLGLDRIDLPSANNIYLAYLQLFTRIGFDLKIQDYQNSIKRKTVGIFAGSRLNSKNLPSIVIDQIETMACQMSLKPVLFLLDGERGDLESSGRPYRLIPKSFKNLISAIESVDLVISTDSLPAHLAERIGRPVFVVSPIENYYWLPLSSFDFKRHSLFADVEESGRLQQFLSGDD